MYTIVVADDEEELRSAIIRKMDWNSIGFQVVGEASNGIEALEMVEKEEPDLLLTDIRMPFLSGIELARQVREIRPTTQIAFLSGYDDFSYAQQAIQYNVISYLLKPISMTDLTQKLLEIKDKLDHLFEEFHILSKVLNDSQSFVVPLLLDECGERDNLAREELLLEQAVACGLIQNSSTSYNYTVMAVRLRDHQGENRTDMELVHSIDIILKKYIKHYSFYTEGRVISLLIGTKPTFDKYLHIIVGEIMQSIERILGMYCDIGISRLVDKLGYCHEAYREAMNALSYSLSGRSNVHYISDEERADFDLSKVPDIILEIENLLRGGSKRELASYLDRMFYSFLNTKNYQIKMKIVLIQVFAAVCKTVYAVTDSDDRKEAWDDTIVDQMNFFEGTFQETKERFIDLCQKASELVSTGRKKSSEILCDQVLYIIEKEYANPEMSLVSVSNQINVSPNYLSALMKKQTGQSFVDLLTKKRIETAKELLLYTPMKIREITEKCGYNDQHYFSYCFKKFYGLSPNVLRQQNAVAGEIV
ncbi:response regulator [Lachnoclostridium phytofermentans]|uniref:Stage 0 sporulation protein A homolog n=1 Tax=Lachnoclostridium phytofermentans (strain ATCC 700394 / DSM 18823 / ISDg) TaxID=357809 RepID=A9KK44_LACP7|nr:response regulator [Lachnoclostridium phytofermentans]ABX42616.1 two component transcriptional regulator, AraC family [Lachnoclostridium phytofermentans ISDg]